MFDDRAFLLDRSQWPGPVCCVKSRTKAGAGAFLPGSPRQFGFIHESEAGPNTWKVRITDLHGSVVDERLYDSLDGLLEDWWVD